MSLFAIPGGLLLTEVVGAPKNRKVVSGSFYAEA